jgi:hypothetical protein
VWGKMPKLEDRTSRDTGRSQPVDATLSSDAHSSENKS